MPRQKGKDDMTRRDFILISDTLSGIWRDRVIESTDDFAAIVSYFADEIASHSPNFDRSRFIASAWDVGTEA